jgi:hypothetical protein
VTVSVALIGDAALYVNWNDFRSSGKVGYEILCEFNVTNVKRTLS